MLKRRFIYVLVAVVILAALGFFMYPRTALEASPELETKTQIVAEAPKEPAEGIAQKIEPIKPKVVIKATQAKNSTLAANQITPEALQAYLENVPKYGHSPLASYASLVLESPHWSTIIGICTIEQYGCTKAPYNNYWGIMCGRGKLCHYASLQEGIKAISALLVKYDSNGHNTLEKLNGYYVSPASATWFNTVLKTKLNLELLK